MRPRSLVLLSGLILTAIACAHSSPVQETGGGGDVASSSSAGGGDVSSSTSAGGGGTGGSIGPCSESPCKLTAPQCGCGNGLQCVTDPNSLDPTYRVCVTAGIQQEGQKCVNGGACAPGLVCTQKAATLSICTTYCATDADCKAPGGLCILSLGDGKGGTIPNASLCTENCDPVGSAQCVGGLACRVDTETTGLLRSYTRCLVAGAGTQMSTCTVNADCAAGYTCVNNGPSSHICAHYCKVGGSDCSGGLSCNALQANGKDVAVGGTTYGACL